MRVDHWGTLWRRWWSGEVQELKRSARLDGIERLERRTLLTGIAVAEPTQTQAAEDDPAGAEVVLFWNQVLSKVLRQDTTLPGAPFATRNAAIVQAAVFDAANAITRAYTPFLVDVTAPAGASIEAAVAGAASRALELIYPGLSDLFATALDQTLSQVPDGPSEEVGLALGRSVAEEIVAARADDNSMLQVPYTPGTAPGEWRPTPPDFTVAHAAGWGHVTPFTLSSVDHIPVPPPPDLASAEYTAAYNEVKELGAANSTSRTPEQTEIGIFWGYDRAGLGTPVALYNQVAATVAQERGSSLMETARVLALSNLAMADAMIVAWDAKYDYNLWRPITGIHEGDADGNPDTAGDPTWEPLGAPGGGARANFTPPFPAYISGHAVLGSALFQTLRNVYGTDEVSFTLESEELPGVTRSYEDLTTAEEENEISRVYLGIHWSFDETVGGEVGRAIADHVTEGYLTPQGEGGVFSTVPIHTTCPETVPEVEDHPIGPVT